MDDLAGLPATAGLSPGGGDPAGERHSLVIEEGQVVVRAAEPAGVARGLTTLLQLVATAPSASSGETGTDEIRVPAARILDAPRYAWRGLSLDVARTFFSVEEIRRVIDLLELYKFNVLHLHLTDDQAWPLALGRPAAGPEPGAPFYRDEDLRDLVGYATDRFVTIVPEIDTPGHTSALLRLRHRPSGIGATAGPGAGGGGGGPVAPRRRDGGGDVGTGDRLTAGPLLPRRPVRRAVG